MQFRKAGDTWKPIDQKERLHDAATAAGEGCLLLSKLTAVLAGLAVIVGIAVILRHGNPIMKTLGEAAIRYWPLLLILPSIGALAGFQDGWHRSDTKSFEEVAIETLQSINDRLESIADAINEKDAYPDEMREELSGISAGLKRLDEIEEQIKSIRD